MGLRPPPPLRRRGPQRARHRGRAVRRGSPRRSPATSARSACAATRRCSPRSRRAAPASSATSSPPSRPSRTRSSAHRRPACWSCRAARAPARPSSPCTAPPTCSTRYRFPLEDQGVLVVGPNRVFLRYIERVLPSLGEAGVELVVLSDLVPDVDAAAARRRRARPRASRATRAWPTSLAKAVHDRERPLREDLVVPFGVPHLRLTVEASRPHRAGCPPALPPPQRRPPVRRERGVRRRMAADRPRSRSMRARTSAIASAAPSSRCARRSSACGRC